MASARASMAHRLPAKGSGHVITGKHPPPLSSIDITLHNWITLPGHFSLFTQRMAGDTLGIDVIWEFPFWGVYKNLTCFQCNQLHVLCEWKFQLALDIIRGFSSREGGVTSCWWSWCLVIDYHRWMGWVHTCTTPLPKFPKNMLTCVMFGVNLMRKRSYQQILGNSCFFI